MALPAASLQRHDHPRIWRRTEILIWVLIGPLFFTTTFVGLPLMFSPHFLQHVQSTWFIAAAQTLAALALAASIMGKSTAPLLRRALRLPSEKSVLLAVAFSIGIPLLIAEAQYLSARAQWAHGDPGAFAPELDTYFHFPPAWLIILFFPAVFEEVIFRGFLQPRLTQRYGLYRGIFLVGIVWSASHFPSDFSFSHFTLQAAILKLASRFLVCIPHSFVFGWIALETGSVLAAALAHTFYNVLIYSDLGPPFAGKNWLRLALWAALAWLLFRYWPVKRRLRLPNSARLPEPIAPAPSVPAPPPAAPESP